MQIINLYWITDSIAGILKLRTQYDRHQGKVSATKQYDEELFTNVLNEIKRVRSEGTKAIIVADYYNQDTLSNNAQKFARESGLLETHSKSNAD